MRNKPAAVRLEMPPELNFLAPSICKDLVRLGKQHDGGYLVPRSVIRQTEHLISFGINDDWSFDAHFLAENPRLKIHAYDHTISPRYFKKRIVNSIMKMLLREGKMKEVVENICLFSRYREFFTNSAQHFSERVYNRKDSSDDVLVETIFQRAGSAKVFLKIDIEGDEYRIIEDIMSVFGKLTGLIIEFHNTEPFRSLFTNAVIALKHHFAIAHVHANNYAGVSADQVPEALEITFVKREFCIGPNKRLHLPIENLDSPNNPMAPDYILTFTL